MSPQSGRELTFFTTTLSMSFGIRIQIVAELLFTITEQNTEQILFIDNKEDEHILLHYK